MNVVVSNQLYVFGYAILYGVMLGISYDIIRIFRRIVKHSRFAIGLEDFFFWLSAGLIIFAYIFEVNQGTMRGFIFIGLILGITIYMLTVSKLFIIQITKLIKLLIKLIKIIINIILTPIKVLLKPIFFLGKKSRRGLKKSKKWLIIKLRRFFKDIYYIIKKK